MNINYQKIWITVPTYWGDYGSPDNPPCIDFDHPTALHGEETLGRTIASISQLPGDFHLLVVLTVTHNEYLVEARSRVQQILEPFQGVKKLYLVTTEDAKHINSLMQKPLLAMNSYGNIRNVQLFVPYCLGAAYVVGIDDDEIIKNPNYLELSVGELMKNGSAGGLAGPYYDLKGEFRLEGAEALRDHENIFLKKNYFMNEALKAAMQRSPHVHPSPIAFGGNMAFTRDTIARVCHDPYIPRGEDYDYVINALMKGIIFYFHPGAGIVHLPPDSEGSQAGDNFRKLKADIRRFIYMSIKLEEHRKRFPDERFDRDILNPYPGAYAIDVSELVRQGETALLKAYPGQMEPTTVIHFVRQAVDDAYRKCDEFFEYQDQWSKLLPECTENSDLRTWLNHLGPM